MFWCFLTVFFFVIKFNVVTSVLHVLEILKSCDFVCAVYNVICSPKSLLSN